MTMSMPRERIGSTTPLPASGPVSGSRIGVPSVIGTGSQDTES
ncbi:hypothetical protein [Streptomyces canus]